MTENQESPLVSIVTPVFNGEQYLAQCIESVCAQTYSNWEYIIVDNRSTDRTREIAESYANLDPRIRIHVNDTFLPLLQNWNHTLRQISGSSKYCKMVHADDWIFPECISAMVRVAENNPGVGIVGAYRIEEDHVSLDRLPYPSTVIPGRTVARWKFLEGRYLFGSPTSLLYRADLVRERECFYNEDNLHADTEVCFDLLRGTDFGFCHQVLTFTRRHNEAVTSTSRKLNTFLPADLMMLKKYGMDYLDAGEFNHAIRAYMKEYEQFLAENIFERIRGGDRTRFHEIWSYHMDALKGLGHKINHARIYGVAISIAYNRILMRLQIH